MENVFVTLLVKYFVQLNALVESLSRVSKTKQHFDGSHGNKVV